MTRKQTLITYKNIYLLKTKPAMYHHNNLIKIIFLIWVSGPLFKDYTKYLNFSCDKKSDGTQFLYSAVTTTRLSLNLSFL